MVGSEWTEAAGRKKGGSVLEECPLASARGSRDISDHAVSTSDAIEATYLADDPVDPDTWSFCLENGLDEVSWRTKKAD